MHDRYSGFSKTYLKDFLASAASCFVCRQKISEVDNIKTKGNARIVVVDVVVVVFFPCSLLLFFSRWADFQACLTLKNDYMEH